jgi:ubiquinone/menaquinone biosynthesis C-methylase UbiE
VVAGRCEHLPFEDDEFDTVVMSYVLCTVTDVPAVLAEIRRILRPGGQYIFMEHVASTDSDLRALQEGVARTGIWRRVACGCEPNRDAETAIRDAGFEIDRLKSAALSPHRRDPIVRFAYKICPMIYGVAKNPACAWGYTGRARI